MGFIFLETIPTILFCFLVVRGARLDNLGPHSEAWDLTEGTRVNSTSNLLFETVSSLFQHWPNTRYRNGHTLVLSTMPRGTLLYHGTNTSQIPAVPDWLAFNPEHSYQFCGQSMIPKIPRTPTSPTQVVSDSSAKKNNDCWHFTMASTRALKLLYFDGSSGAKMSGGPLDTQDLLAWGEVRPDLTFDERGRIDKLCDWGSKYQLDGFVRMEMDFEVMFCNFTNGLEPVSRLNLRFIQDDPMDVPSSPSGALRRTLTTQAGSRANRFPGDLRIKPDYSRLISFYDEDLFPGLHAKRIALERWDHQLQGITKEEMSTLNSKLDTMLLTNSTKSTSGVDWGTLLHLVTEQFAERLELLSYVLNSTPTPTDHVLEKAHRYVSSMVIPYTLNDIVAPKNWTGTGRYDWAAPVFRECATSRTKHLVDLDESLPEGLSDSEKLLLKAVRDVSKEICRALVKIWVEGEETWGATLEYDPMLSDQIGKDFNLDETKNQSMLEEWRTSISSLMRWLDWSIWVRCEPECGYEEMCYLPTWPYFLRHPHGRPRSPNPGEFVQGLLSQPRGSEEEWRRPKPKCIRRLEPYSL